MGQWLMSTRIGLSNASGNDETESCNKEFQQNQWSRAVSHSLECATSLFDRPWSLAFTARLSIISSNFTGNNDPRLRPLNPEMSHWRNPGLILESPTSNDADQASVSGMVAPISVKPSPTVVQTRRCFTRPLLAAIPPNIKRVLSFSVTLNPSSGTTTPIEKNALLVDRWQSAQWQA